MSEVVDSPERVERRKVRQRVRVRGSSERIKRRRRRMRRLRIALVVLGVLIALLGLSLVPALAVRDRLDEARVRLEGAVSALLAGDASAARDEFRGAEDAFLRAEDQIGNPILRAAGWLPVAGRTPDAVTQMARAGALIARGGHVVAAALAELPQGTVALAPEDGTIPLAPLRRLAPALEEARDAVAEAGEGMEASPSRGLIGPVARAQTELLTELDRGERAVRAAAALSRALPAFLGSGGVRRYFLAAQNPAELRGTGGFIGAYAILTAREGSIELSEFRPIETLPNLDVDEIEPPNSGYAARYDAYGGAGFWRNINMTGDFPSAAVAIERLYEEVRGVRLDGTIAADPLALAALMEAIGEQVEVPRSDRAVDAASLVPFVTNEAYSVFTDAQARKRLLGEVAEEVLDRFLAGGFPTGPAGAGRAVVEAASGGHLLLHSTRPSEQQAFRQAGVDGALGPSSGDFLAVIANNAAGNKADFYAERSIDYMVDLGADGTGIGTATVELANAAPTSGQPPYVIGPYSDEFEAGENVTLLDVYCSRACGLEEVRVNGAPGTAGAATELGHQVFTNRVSIPSGGSRVLEYRRSLPQAWDGDDAVGTYRLVFRGQPTIRPAQLSVDVRAPDGMEIVRASPGVDVSGSRAVWDGTAPDRLTLEVDFQRPWWSRMWRGIARFLGSPVF